MDFKPADFLSHYTAPKCSMLRVCSAAAESATAGVVTTRLVGATRNPKDEWDKGCGLDVCDENSDLLVGLGYPNCMRGTTWAAC